MKFRLYGTSLSGIEVNEYAVTDKNGIAKFKDVLIGTGYTLEEVDTPTRYVVPEKQTAAIEWNKVTNKSFDNILKKFNVTVTKSDSEKGLPQGDASLAGAKYGIYKGNQLIDTYTTDANGQFICARTSRRSSTASLTNSARTNASQLSMTYGTSQKKRRSRSTPRADRNGCRCRKTRNSNP